MLQNLLQTVISISKIEIDDHRKELLNSLVAFIQNKVNDQEEVRLNFICSHNSRRSHLSQIWAQTMAHYFKIQNVYCYSGGTEATALFPKVAETVERQGFKILKLSTAINPIYAIKFDNNAVPIIGFSKEYFDDFNPETQFAAIMTCSQADGECPFISGAEKRIALPYDDPKIFDKTAEQSEKYEERSVEIAAEMYYVFSKITDGKV